METTLDEWEILHAVVQLGGFAPAAQQLNRSQSTISYAIARLQDSSESSFSRSRAGGHTD
jgi:DNA-binding transcriptional LysR family regulator